MNWTHSGAVVRMVGFAWIVAAILAVTGASADVWLACGVAATSLGLAGAFHSRSESGPSPSLDHGDDPFNEHRGV
jgi:hypothetical protein